MSTVCDGPLCDFSCPTKALWLSHLRSVHSQDEDFTITCDINECNASYTKCASFVSHIYRQHRGVIVGDQPTACTSTAVNIDSGGGSGSCLEIEDIGEFELDDMFEHASPRSDLQHTIDRKLITRSSKRKEHFISSILRKYVDCRRLLWITL